MATVYKGKTNPEEVYEKCTEDDAEELIHKFMFKKFEEFCDRVVDEGSDDEVDDEEDGEEFEAGEHVCVGEKINLYYSENEVRSGKEMMTLPNGIQLSFGEIVALSGDFYGVPEAPIVNKLGDEDYDRKVRFMAAYNTLAGVSSDVIAQELEELKRYIKKEKALIEEAINDYDPKTMRRIITYKPNGESTMYQIPKIQYEKFKSNERLDENFDKITGGKWCIHVPIIYGRYLRLALNNQDHFLPYAKDAYIAGHQLALEKAQEAGRSYDKALLDVAYSMDAFACHFLTDSFSSGHMRTPRVELPSSTSSILASFGHLLTKHMHDEDNTVGLRVRNASNKWVAYGDGMLATEESSDNLKMVTEAVQVSVNQVYEAFKDPSTLPDSSLMSTYIPVVDDSWSETKNHYPMFRMINGEMHRRTNLNKLDDPLTITNWTSIGSVLHIFRNPINHDESRGVSCQACTNIIN